MLNTSQMKLNGLVLVVGISALAGTNTAHGQFFEGCGVLKPDPLPESCIAFFPKSGDFPDGLSRINGWDNFQVGDRFHVNGIIVACGGICTIDGCFEADSVLSACTTTEIPTTSIKGLLVMGILMLLFGSVVIRKSKQRRTSHYSVWVNAILS